MRYLPHALFICLCCPTWATAAPITLDADSQSNLSITLYTDNLGLIQERRKRPALAPEETVVIAGVSQLMQPQTLQIRQAGTIREQTLQSNVINYDRLLQQHLGQPITLARKQPSGEELHQTVRLLSADTQMLLVEHNGQVESVPMSTSPDWRVIFPKQPANLLLSPSLAFVSEGIQQPGELTLSYLTQGLSWQMDYVLTLNQDNSAMELDGLASLINETGIPLNNAQVHLLAGDVYQAAPQRHYRAEKAMLAMAAADNAGAPQALSDYQLYTLERAVNLADQQRTQVPLLHADTVKVNALQRYQFYLHSAVDNQTERSKPESFIRFVNNPHHGLGSPLPAGQVRFFSPDKDGQLHYSGAATLPQTAVGEQVELAMGKAFDVTITRQQTDYQSAFDGTVTEYQLRIQNSAKSNRVVEISSLFSQPWQLISSSETPAEQTAGMARWQLQVAGNSEHLLTMRVRLTDKQ